MKRIIYLIYRIICLFINAIILLLNNSSFMIPNVRQIFGIIRIRNNGKIIVGKKLKIISAFSYNPIGFMSFTSIFVQKNAVLRIGDYTGISNSIIYCSYNIEIGSNVFIGGDCKIYDTDFHSLNYDKRISDSDNDIHKNIVRIENGVFLGTGCIILKGITIGEKSIIGAGSVVSKSIPPNQIWAGNPIKYLRSII